MYHSYAVQWQSITVGALYIYIAQLCAVRWHIQCRILGIEGGSTVNGLQNTDPIKLPVEAIIG